MEEDGVMMRSNDYKFGKKRRFGKMEVRDKNGEKAEGRERRGWEWGHTLEGGGRGRGKLWSHY